jgi:signal transduction histidine kinase
MAKQEEKEDAIAADIELKKVLVKGQEDERARLAQELHDGIGPLLTTLKLRVGSVEMANEEKDALKAMIDNTITEIRRISNNLMPSVLRDFGVGEALRNLTHTVQASTSRLAIKYQSDISHPDRIPPEIQLALYRIAQEGINNALKHANPGEIRLSITQFDNRVSLFLTDDGSGFNSEIRHAGNGLRNMKVRVEMFQGTIAIHSGKEGTTIEIDIPIGQ